MQLEFHQLDQRWEHLRVCRTYGLLPRVHLRRTIVITVDRALRRDGQRLAAVRNFQRGGFYHHALDLAGALHRVGVNPFERNGVQLRARNRHVFGIVLSGIVAFYGVAAVGDGFLQEGNAAILRGELDGAVLQRGIGIEVGLAALKLPGANQGVLRLSQQQRPGDQHKQQNLLRSHSVNMFS